MAGLLYQLICGIAVVFHLQDLYSRLRFYPFPESGFWYALYAVGCLVALYGIGIFYKKKNSGVAYYFVGKLIMLIFLMHALMEKFTVSFNEPYIETYLAGIGVWIIYPILILVLLKTQNT
jgi:hypothetical protein